MLALQAQGANVTTIEGLAAADGTLHPMQAAFRECHGLQCGFCTPGMVMSAVDLVKRHPNADEADDPRGARRQPLPLHRLPQHRQGGAAGRRRHGASRRTTMGAIESRRSSANRFAAQGGLRASSPAPASTPTTSRCRNQTYAYFLRSPHAHAQIRGIDTTTAKAAPGVVAIFTGADLDRRQRPALRLAHHRAPTARR